MPETESFRIADHQRDYSRKGNRCINTNSSLWAQEEIEKATHRRSEVFFDTLRHRRVASQTAILYNRPIQFRGEEMIASKAALFDMDGTLIDSKAHHLLSWKELFKRHGYPVCEEDILRTFGQTTSHMLQALLPSEHSSERIEAFANEKEKLFRDMIRDELTLLPGARELLLALRQAHYGIALATSAPPENARMVLKELEIASLFDVTVGEQDITRSKPDPEIFLLAAKRLGIQPGHCVVFEDSPSGVRAAAAANMSCVAITTGYLPSELTDADIWIEDFRSIDVPAIEALIASH